MATNTSSDIHPFFHRSPTGLRYFFTMRKLLPLLMLLSGCTAPQDTLHAAVKRNDSAAVERLLAGGAVVDARDAAGLTPLMLACMNLQEQNIRLLVQAGANPRLRNAAGTSAEQMLLRGDSIPSRAPACRRALQEARQQAHSL
jgi:hypothetical protein